MMRPLVRRECLHREGVDFFAHTIAQCAVNNLVALNARLARERGGDDYRLKMRAITFDGEMRAIEFFADISLYCFWGNHGAVLNLTDKLISMC